MVTALVHSMSFSIPVQPENDSIPKLTSQHKFLEIIVSNAKSKAFPLNIKVPTNVACTGGSTGNLCLLQVKNPSGFGGGGLNQQGAMARTARRGAKTANTHLPQG